MKKLLNIFIVVAVLAFVYVKSSGGISGLPNGSTSSEQVTDAYNDHRSGVQMSGEGVVSKILADDTKGSRHQRFILRLDNGHTLLMAHNIDLAPRINHLKVGDEISFNGVYEWNNKGGVIHWTHDDPNGRHQAGWLKKNGSVYQ
ncbi:DUF3465 domain-containing protein [Rubritalea profundi]|uniref:DUF3465 domain-containing protein n=1 Tax=Rubritalea profundi TaxID=1658618 RepID=A0A2S7TYP4_9BACT|nr:DUF3465 domain-containing protein [Rubritalea profundi]PQJ27440.1 hypothetical protein BSZ32_02300 [Rubritalea profundi]